VLWISSLLCLVAWFASVQAQSQPLARCTCELAAFPDCVVSVDPITNSCAVQECDAYVCVAYPVLPPVPGALVCERIRSDDAYMIGSDGACTQISILKIVPVAMIQENACGIEGDFYWENWHQDVSSFAQVVFPQSLDEVASIVTQARSAGCQVSVRGSGSSQNGIVAQRNERNLVIIHLSKLDLSQTEWRDQYFPGTEDIFTNPFPHRARIGAGRSLLQLQAMIRPEGALLPVQPATFFFSIGGVVMAPVVGAYQNNRGYVYDYVTGMLVMDSSGVVSEVFEEEQINQIIGSQGLTYILLAAEFKLRQDFGFNAELVQNQYNFELEADQQRFMDDQLNFATTSMFFHNFMSPYPEGDMYTVQTLVGTPSGIPFTPNNDLGDPDLNELNAFQKVIYTSVFGALETGFADAAYSGPFLDNSALDLCNYVPQITELVLSLCNIPGSRMPCDVNCTTIQDWPLAFGSFVSALISGALGEQWNAMAMKQEVSPGVFLALSNNDGYYTYQFANYQSLAGFFPFEGLESLLSLVLAYIANTRPLIDQAILNMFNEAVPRPSATIAGTFEFRYVITSGKSQFDPFPAGEYIEYEMLNFGADPGMNRVFRDIEVDLTALGAVPVPTKTAAYGTNPNWNFVNPRDGQVELVSWQDQSIYEKIWSGKEESLLTIIAEKDPSRLFFVGGSTTYLGDSFGDPALSQYDPLLLNGMSCRLRGPAQCQSQKCDEQSLLCIP